MSLTSIAFLGVYAFGLLRAFVTHPSWGLLTYIAVFYLHPPMRWWGASLPESFRWALVAAIVTLLALPRAKLPNSFAPWSSLPVTKVSIAFVVWMWIQLAWANPMHFEDLVLMSKFLLLYFLFYRIVTDKTALANVAFAHILGCLYFGWLAFDADGAGRLEYIGGPGVNDSNTLGMHVSTSLFFAATIIFTQSGWRRWATLAAMPFIVNCIVQTESRGAFLGAFVGSLVFYYYAPKKQRKMLIPLGVLGLCIMLAYAPASYWERIASIGAATSEEKEIDSSAESRIHIIKAQFEMLKDYPFGLGSRTTSYLSRQYLDTRWLTVAPGQDLATEGARASHNSFMSIATDQGLPGILIACIGAVAVLRLFMAMRRVTRVNRDPALTLYGASACATLTTVYVAGMFTNYLRAEIQIWAMAILIIVLQLVGRSMPTAPDVPRTR